MTKLWQHMAATHDLHLLESEEHDIMHAANEDAELTRRNLINQLTELQRELNDLRKTAGIVADWLERSHQINPADMVSRNMDLAKELRSAAMPNRKS